MFRRESGSACFATLYFVPGRFRFRCSSLLAPFVSELLNSGGLDDSREAEEESKLCSVPCNYMRKRVVCQTEDSGRSLSIREVSKRIHCQSAFLVVFALGSEPQK